MTPTDSAEKVVAELREVAAVRRQASADERNKALFVVAKLSRQDGDLMERAAALLESQRATIERLEAIDKADLLPITHPIFAMPANVRPFKWARLVGKMKARIEAAEARVTALEAERAKAVADEREACARLVEDMPIQIYRDLGIGPAGRSCKPATFEDAAERIRARAAVSPSTEVKNDGA